MILRDYQKEVLDKMLQVEQGAYLIQLATGLGKTVVFTEYINMTSGNVLILSHREELIAQPIKYINKRVGIEKSKEKSNGESVISASVQSLSRRLEKFQKNHFDVIITDECHHSPCKSYTDIYDYFDFKIHFGFTATPNRNDQVKLNHIFSKIIYKKDLIWGIKNNYLSNIQCKRFYINYDLSQVKSSNGDFQVGALEEAVNNESNVTAIAKIYKDHAKGPTLIFGVSVNHCYEIQKHISGSVVIDSKTKNRGEIIQDFTAGKIKCLINYMIFTEGTDIPRIETLVIARPTKNISLYTQMVGRGLRLWEDKKHLNLIDCCGVSNNNLCTAPSLLGINVIETKEKTPMTRDMTIEGDLFELESKIEKKQNNPDTWRINYKIVKLFENKNNYNLHNINFIKAPNGDLVLKTKTINERIKSPDLLGEGFQEEVERLYEWLLNEKMDERYMWDLSLVKSWGRKPASEKQKNLIKRFLQNYNVETLNMMEANQILGRLMV